MGEPDRAKSEEVMMGYLDVPIPNVKEGKKHQKEYFKFNPAQRRGFIARLLLQEGHPRAVSQTKLADQFGVSDTLIHKDIVEIKKEIIKELPKDAEFFTNIVFSKVTKDLLKGDNKDKFNALKAIKMYYDWLFDSGVKRKVPQEFKDVSEYSLADAYKDLLDDEKKQKGKRVAKKKAGHAGANKKKGRKVPGKK